MKSEIYRRCVSTYVHVGDRDVDYKLAHIACAPAHAHSHFPASSTGRSATHQQRRSDAQRSRPLPCPVHSHIPALPS